MKVAFLRTAFGREGVGTVTNTTAKLFHDKGIEVCYIVQYFWGQWEPPFEGLEIHYLPNKRRFESQANKEALYKIVREEGIDVIFAPIWQPFFNNKDREHLGNCKLVWWIHNLPYWEWYQVVYKMKASLLSVSKLWYNLFRKHRYEKSDAKLNQIKEQYKKNIQLYDKTIVLSKFYKEQLENDLNLTNKEKDSIIVATNTADTSFEVDASQTDKEDLVIFMGRLDNTQKRIYLLLEIWAMIESKLPKSWHLQIWGGGDAEEGLKQLADKLRLSRIQFCGSTSDPMSVYKRAKIICFTSAFEGWPMTILEAQQQGVIPISFDSFEAIYEMIGKDKQYGRIVSNNNLKEFADKLEELCTNDQLQQEIISRLPEKCNDYAPNINNQRWEKLFSDLLDINIKF